MRKMQLDARMNENLPLLIDRVDTPIGEMLIVADRAGNLRAVDWTDYETRMRRLLSLHYGNNGFKLEPARNPNGLTDAISSYFAENLQELTICPCKQPVQLFSEKCGARCEAFHVAQLLPTRTLPGKSIDLLLSGLSAWLTVQIPLVLSFLAIV